MKNFHDIDADESGEITEFLVEHEPEVEADLEAVRESLAE